jgi:hypothetical protein
VRRRLVGSWDLVATCNIDVTTTTTGFCADQRQYTVSGFDQTGTYEFLASGAFAVTVRATGTISDVYPAACLAQDGAFTCAELDTTTLQLAQTGMVYSSGSCAMIGASCACTLMLDATVSGVGTYTTSGSTLNLTVNGASGSSSYCVHRSSLTIATPSATGGPPDVFVLVKR